MFVGEFNVDTSHGDRASWWRAIYNVIENDNAGGSAFWWFESQQIDPKYGISMASTSELAVFKQHSEVMQKKSSLLV